MQTIGIVAEYDPFHTGHRYQICASRQAAGEDAAVVAVMSGNWVQRADCAIADKWRRARLALMGGVDLVLELPTVWATSSAEGFARGAVAILDASGVVDRLSFGSECGDLDRLVRVAACLDSPSYQQELTRRLQLGLSFPAARQAAVSHCIGQDALLLSSPNNNLGIEYIRASSALHSQIQPMTIQRQGAPHNAVAFSQEDPDRPAPTFLSATQLRMDMTAGRWDRAEPYLLPGTRQLLEDGGVGLPRLEHVSRAILAKIRTMSAQAWACLPDSGAPEGLPARLERAGHQAASIAEFLQMARTKRYTSSRLDRLVLRAYLGIDRSSIPARPPYLRVLGFNSRGRELLKMMKQRASLPVITKPAHAKLLDPEGRRLFQAEARYTDLYDLCFEKIPAPGREWTHSPAIVER